LMISKTSPSVAWCDLATEARHGQK
jgi:hypothetical protein